MKSKRRSLLKSLVPLNELMIQYYREVRRARKEGRKVAWVSLGFPVELLYALDIVPVFPQMAAVMGGLRGRAGAFFEAAEGIGGYSTNLCSELRASLGAMLSGDREKLGLPDPDMVLCCNNICGSVLNYFKAIKSHFGVSGFFIDTPVVQSTFTEEMVRYVMNQMVDCVSYLEERAGRGASSAELSLRMQNSQEAYKLWMEILNLCKSIPSPLNSMDAFAFMFPITILRGREEPVRFYRILKKEIQGRVDRGVGALEHERIRLLWDFLPIYYKKDFLNDLLERDGACVVVGSYFYPRFLDSDEEPRMHLLGGLSDTPDGSKESECIRHMCMNALAFMVAHEYGSIYVNQGIGAKAEMMASLIREFKVDGFVIHADVSCKPHTLPQYEVLRIVREKTGVPGLLFEADSMDERTFSEGQVATRLEAFLESLDGDRREETGT